MLKQHAVMAVENAYDSTQADSIMIMCFGDVCLPECSCVQDDFTPRNAAELYLVCNHDAYQ